MALQEIFVIGTTPSGNPAEDWDSTSIRYGYRNGQRFMQVRHYVRTAGNLQTKDTEFVDVQTYNLMAVVQAAGDGLDQMTRNRTTTNVFVCAELDASSGYQIWYGPVMTNDGCYDQTGHSTSSKILKLKSDGTQVVVASWDGAQWVNT